MLHAISRVTPVAPIHPATRMPVRPRGAPVERNKYRLVRTRGESVEYFADNDQEAIRIAMRKLQATPPVQDMKSRIYELSFRTCGGKCVLKLPSEQQVFPYLGQ